MSLPFLLEIGTEEIPDSMIVAWLEQFRIFFDELRRANSLGGGIARTDATPRRLVLRVDNIIERQLDIEDERQGPTKSAGPKAAAGFAKKIGVPVDELFTKMTPKGEYFYGREKIEGKEGLPDRAREKRR